jgi:hypothetical protein
LPARRRASTLRRKGAVRVGLAAVRIVDIVVPVPYNGLDLWPQRRGGIIGPLVPASLGRGSRGRPTATAPARRSGFRWHRGPTGRVFTRVCGPSVRRPRRPPTNNRCVANSTSCWTRWRTRPCGPTAVRRWIAFRPSGRSDLCSSPTYPSASGCPSTRSGSASESLIGMTLRAPPSK